MTSTYPTAHDRHLPAFGALTQNAARLLPLRNGRWREAVVTVDDDRPHTIELRDRNRRVTVTCAEEHLVIRGGGAPSTPVTQLPLRFASARNLAAAIARDHLRQPIPAPESAEHGSPEELAALGALSTAVARLTSGRTGWLTNVYRGELGYITSWGRSGRRGEARVDGPERVQLYLEGVRFPKLVEALSVALPPADARPVIRARPSASTVLLSAYPVLWHEPGSEPDDMLLGSGTGSVTVSVQIPPTAKPTRGSRTILTLECDLDLALMVLALLA
ncbi:hypothetical protein ACFC26_21860 [Kitasatospora purpeofusca]|uniref:hypothetical protein n=1 Tax=Kitasatospora purpeofusca TaxID=67352 RepID=UPI0035DD1483